MKASEEAVTTEVYSPISLELALCKACGICIAVCPAAVFDRDDLGFPVVARQGDCTACLLCELHCPDFAIEIRRRATKRSKASDAADSARALAAVAGQRPSDDECATHGEED